MRLTGASYLIGAEAELEIKVKMEKKYNVPFVTAALATVEALNDLNVKKYLCCLLTQNL